MAIWSYTIDTSIDIDCHAEAIWDTLVDFDRFHEWNPMLRNVHTDLNPGAMVTFDVLQDEAKPLKLKAKIVNLARPTSLAWRGGVSGIITGEHYFRLEPLPEGRCRFHHGETFKGLLLPLLRGRLKQAPRLYRAMNAALKSRLERGN